MSEIVPRQFGKYVLLKSLARGGMGEIYLAASGQAGGLNKLCVIKKVITEKTDPAKINRFLDEAKVVLRLSHANLVSTFDAGDVNGDLFIAMELVEGKDLREIWNRCVRTRTRIPVDVALVVVREIARALAYVHTYSGLRLVHRDVAPPNILLSYFGDVKLTDFGLARSVLKQEHTAPGVVFGRASYLAPEQARGEVADARTDVYSLGIVLWELLTGQPFMQLAGLDPVTSLSLVRNPRAEAPSTRAPWISPELDEIVLKTLAADRAGRFQSAEDLREALADVMTRVVPRADSQRVAEFLQVLYRDVVGEESAERERLLAQTLPLFRGENLPPASTPRTNVIPGAAPPGSVARGVDHLATTAPVGARISRITDAPRESLHVSALRARADFTSRRPVKDSPSGDSPTKVWRKGRAGAELGEDPDLTFVGQVIDGRYRVRHRIGEGGMGTVYAAEHVDIGKGVAVKILHRVFSGEEQLVERFRREARAASQVGHPHIVEVSDFGTTGDGCTYFVMELLEGMDLAALLARETRLDAARAVRIAIQICQALEAAHARGVIHRDLKPENIFLVSRAGQTDFVKVLDFGIAHNLFGESRRLTNPGMAMGTPEYMAPEQSQGKPADPRTDVYALGAMLHEMVMGSVPFQADSPTRMLEAKRRPLPSLRERRPDLPAALDAIILGALASDPERRPQTMAEFERALGVLAEAAAPEPAAPPDPPRPGWADFEKLLEAQPPPAVAGAPSGNEAGTAFPDVDIDPMVPPAGGGSRVRARVAGLSLLVLIGGAAAWSAAHGVPSVAQHWFHWPRNRSPLPPSGIGSRAPAQSDRSTAPGGSPATTGAPASAEGSPPSARSESSSSSTPLHLAPEIVPTSPLGRAREALAAGLPDDAVAVLRPAAARGDVTVKALLAQALVESGWNEVKGYRWNRAIRKAREALALSDPTESSQGAHALLGEALYGQGNFAGALGELLKALAESPRDARLRRRVIRARRQLRRPADGPEDDTPSAPSDSTSEQ